MRMTLATEKTLAGYLIRNYLDLIARWSHPAGRGRGRLCGRIDARPSAARFCESKTTRCNCLSPHKTKSIR